MRKYRRLDWQELPLKKVISVIGDHRGRTPPKLAAGKYRVFSAKNIKTGRIVAEDTIGYFDDELYAKYVRLELKRGDIIITSEAPFGEIFYWDSDEKAALSQRLFSVRIKDEFCAKFIYYYMTYEEFQSELARRSCGTTVLGLRQPELLKCIIRFPPLPTQRKIAKVLSAYDDLIENNTKRITILERMAEELYRQMFENTERANFCESGQVLDWFDITIGRTPPRKNQEYFSTESTDQKWVSIKDMRASGMFVFDTAEKLTPAGVDASKIHISPAGSILLSFKLTVGLVSIAATSVATNEAIAHFETNDRALRDYTYFYLKRFKYGTLGSTSSIANAINSEIVRKMPFVLPARDTLLKYERVVGPMFDYISILARQNRNLARQRDLLLPRLMSGKLSVES